jgi:hypothetical protein
VVAISSQRWRASSDQAAPQAAADDVGRGALRVLGDVLQHDDGWLRRLDHVEEGAHEISRGVLLGAVEVLLRAASSRGGDAWQARFEDIHLG